MIRMLYVSIMQLFTVLVYVTRKYAPNQNVIAILQLKSNPR